MMLNAAESETTFTRMLEGQMEVDEIASLLKKMHQRGETEAEVLGAAKALRRKMLPFEGAAGAIDCCGTGGDNHGTLNISTAVMFVLAGGGVKVAKHGNRAVSSKSGSSDVLTALGVNIEASTDTMRKALAEANLCFLMAPRFHPTLKTVAPVRAALGHRTIFNLLGPLLNPAHVTHHVVGVFDRVWCSAFVRILKELGSTALWAVHGHDGLDEITSTAPTHVAQLKSGAISEFDITPEKAGIVRARLMELKGADTKSNAQRLVRMLEGQRDAYRDIVLLNAAAGFVIMNRVTNLEEGVMLGIEVIENGKARAALQTFVDITHG